MVHFLLTFFVQYYIYIYIYIYKRERERVFYKVKKYFWYTMKISPFTSDIKEWPRKNILVYLGVQVPLKVNLMSAWQKNPCNKTPTYTIQVPQQK